MTQDDRPLYVLLHDALEQVRLVDQRLIGLRSALPHATRNVDRRILTNDADSMRLKLSVALESLQDALDMLRQRRNPE